MSPRLIVNMDAFLAAVQTRLAGFGYACCIGNATGKRLQVKGGNARTASGAIPAMPFTFTTKHGLASVAKVLTAAAAIILLDPPQRGAKPRNLHGFDLDTFMYRALPSDWNVHPVFRTITFRDLLAHTSGLPEEGAADDPGQDYDSLKNFLTQSNPPPLLSVAPVWYSGNDVGVCAAHEWNPQKVPNKGHSFDQTVDFTLLETIVSVQNVLLEAFLDSAIGP